jgi:hypothetical protein
MLDAPYDVLEAEFRDLIDRPHHAGRVHPDGRRPRGARRDTRV